MTDLTTAAAEQLSHGAQGSAEFVQKVGQWNEVIDSTNMAGLLPLAIALLILHELYYATSENRAPRFWWLLMRVVGFSAALLCYGRIVGVLTGVLGGGTWADPTNIIRPLDAALNSHLSGPTNSGVLNFIGGGMENLVWTFLFAIDCLVAALAFIATTVVIKGQALLLLIFISAGKTCLILSIMPGVGIAKSWAKAVATVAAWSFMAKFVYTALGAMTPSVGNYSASISVEAHMQVWLGYALLTIFTVMIPKLVNSLVSGGVSAAPGLGAAMAGGFMAMKFAKLGSKAITGAASAIEVKRGDVFMGHIDRHGGKVARQSKVEEPSLVGLGGLTRVAPVTGEKRKQNKESRGTRIKNALRAPFSKVTRGDGSSVVANNGSGSVESPKRGKGIARDAGMDSSLVGGTGLRGAPKSGGNVSQGAPRPSGTSKEKVRDGSSSVRPNGASPSATTAQTDSFPAAPQTKSSDKRGDQSNSIGGAVSARTTAALESPRSSDAGNYVKVPAAQELALSMNNSSANRGKKTGNIRGNESHKSVKNLGTSNKAFISGRYSSKQERSK